MQPPAGLLDLAFLFGACRRFRVPKGEGAKFHERLVFH